MDARRFRRLLDVVGAALARPADERDAWVAARCIDDPELHAEARALLADAEDESAVALSAALEAGVAAAAAHVELPAPRLPAHIGPYRIVEVLGAGGMGVVYGARQEHPLRRDVAVKVIRGGVHAPGLIARFDAERRTLAALDHPGIARVHDAGSTEDGLPYFAMEWVRGEPIIRYCDARRLTLEQRLRLYAAVLGAVQHAHQKAVVHRDLKPSNILVTEVDGAPVPKVIDFGVARVLTPDPGTSTAHTAAGAVLGTLEYMSPEQLVAADSADTRTDVYALGVLLYELMSGYLPLGAGQLRTASPAQLERLLRDTDPPTPSRRVATAGADAGAHARARALDTRRLVRSLRGDIDNIVGMATRKDPAQRYRSVAHLADDIARCLSGRPVHAHPATIGYRTKRFIGRHRAGVAVAAAVVLALTASTALFTTRLAAERDRARYEADKATQVASFLQHVFQRSEPWATPGQPVTARALLDEASGRIDIELADQPDLQAELMRIMGEAYHALGSYDRALPLLNGAVERHRVLFGERSAELAASRTALATALLDSGDLAAAGPLYQQALTTLEQRFGADDPRVTAAHSRMAVYLDRAGDRAGAEQTLRTVLAQQQRQQQQGHPGAASAAARTMVRLSTLLRRDDRLDEAEALLRGAVAARSANNDASHADYASAQRNLAALLRDRGAYAESDSLYREVIALRRDALGNAHPEVAVTLNSYGLLLQRMGRYDDAIVVLTEAVTMLDAVRPAPHPVLANAAHNLALQLRHVRRFDEAEMWLSRALEVQDRLLPDGHVDRAFPRVELARLYMEQGQHARAEPLLREALALRTAGLAPGHRRIADVLRDLDACLRALGREAEAEALPALAP